MSDEKTRLLKTTRSLKKQQLLRDISRKLGAGTAGLIFGAALAADLQDFEPDDIIEKRSSLYPKPDWRSPLFNCADVSDTLSFEEAFVVARNGEGRHGMFCWNGRVFCTLYKQEAEKLNKEEKKAYYAAMLYRYRDTSEYKEHDSFSPPSAGVIVYDEAPQAEKVNDAMDFIDAFVVARDEVGPSGFFQWQGESYQTFSREELALLTAEQLHDFNRSMNGILASPSGVGNDDFEIIDLQNDPDDGDIQQFDLSNDPLLLLNAGEHLLIDRYIENDRGVNVRIGIYLNNFDVIVKLDWAGNGQDEKKLHLAKDGKAEIWNVDKLQARLSAEELRQLITEVCEPRSTTWVSKNAANA